MRVYLGSSEAVDALAFVIGPALFLHKSTYSRSRVYKSLGHKFVVLDEEGGVTTPLSTIEEFCQWRYSSMGPDMQDIVFLPGRKWHKIVSSMDNSKGVKLFTSGWPRVDLWRQEYASLYSDAVSKIRKSHGTFYLFVTSFGGARKETFEDLIDDSPNEMFRKIQQHKYEAFLDYKDLILRLSSLIEPNEKIIVRPHPSERVSEWKELFKGVKKLEVIREGDISPWILAAKSIIQFGSTTVTQASLNGKRSVDYKVKPKKGVTDSPSFELTMSAQTTQEVYELISTAPDFSKAEIGKAKDYLKAEMDFDDDVLAVEKIVTVLDQEAQPPVPKAKVSLALLARLAFLHYGSAAKYLAQKFKLLQFKGKTIFENIPDGITSREVEETVRKLESIQGWRSVDTVLNVGKNLVCIEPV